MRRPPPTAVFAVALLIAGCGSSNNPEQVRRQTRDAVSQGVRDGLRDAADRLLRSTCETGIREGVLAYRTVQECVADRDNPDFPRLR